MTIEETQRFYAQCAARDLALVRELDAANEENVELLKACQDLAAKAAITLILYEAAKKEISQLQSHLDQLELELESKGEQ